MRITQRYRCGTSFTSIAGLTLFAFGLASISVAEPILFVRLEPCNPINS